MCEEMERTIRELKAKVEAQRKEIESLKAEILNENELYSNLWAAVDEAIPNLALAISTLELLKETFERSL